MGEGQRKYKPGDRIPGTVYCVVKLIGAGGMGTVYDVEDTTVGKRYVLKTLHPELGSRTDLAKRMEAEARSLARLTHPNIVEVITAGVTTDDLHLPYFVMEKLNGQNLRVILSKKGSLELPHALHIGIDLLDALECAHDKNVFHRDVKPDNIFLHRGANNVTVTKLLDFGISRDLALPSTTGARFMGTLRYAGPEQLLGQPVTARTDVYSAALVVFEMIAGRGPFDDQGEGPEIAHAHMNRPAPSLSDFVLEVPPALDKLLRSALAKDPAKRPKDAFTFASQLRNLKQQEERPQRGPDSPTAVAMIRGLDTSKPPSPILPAPIMAEPVISIAPEREPDTSQTPAALAPTLHAQTRASTPEAKSPETVQGMQTPTIEPPGSTLVSAGTGASPARAGSPPHAAVPGPQPRIGGVDRSAETRSAVPGPMPGPGRTGTQPITIDLSRQPWDAVASAGIRDTIRDSKPSGYPGDTPRTPAPPSDLAETPRLEPKEPEQPSAQQLLVALPGQEPAPARTDGASVSNVAPHASTERKRSIAIAVVAVASFAVVATGTVAVGIRWHRSLGGAGATAETAAPAASFPNPVVAPPTLATPLFDEIPSASAVLPAVAASASASAAPSARVPAAAAPAVSASTAVPPPPAKADQPKPATPPADEPRPHAAKPARTVAPAPAPSASVPPKRKLPGSGL